MRRREFIAVVDSAALASPLMARAQQSWVEISRSDQSPSFGATFQRSPPDPAPEFGYCGKIESSQTRGMVSALSELQSRHS